MQEETRSGSRVDVTLRLRIIETLSPQDLSGQTPYRDFEIIVSSSTAINSNEMIEYCSFFSPSFVFLS